MLEQEVKIQYDSADEAREAVRRAGGRRDIARRLLDDRLYDTLDLSLRRRGLALRIRRDGGRAFVTLKGPVQPGAVKIREEHETTIGDPLVLESAFALLGYQCTFRSQKYREEYLIGAARVTIDEAPVGIFVEIEGSPDSIARVTAELGRTAADYRLESYPTLWRRWCADHGRPFGDMVFQQPG
jgi:adenylate cyclase class 2